jgi:hypothetical protein
VLRFKEEITGKIIYKTFGDEGEFRERFEHVITDYVQKLKLSELKQPVQEAPVPTNRAQPGAGAGTAEVRPQLPLKACGSCGSLRVKPRTMSKLIPLT